MERRGEQVTYVARTSQKQWWKLRLNPKLPARRHDRMRLALYWLDGVSVSEKERFVTGGQCTWMVSRWDITRIKQAAEGAGSSLRFEDVVASDTGSVNEQEGPDGKY